MTTSRDLVISSSRRTCMRSDPGWHLSALLVVHTFGINRENKQLLKQAAAVVANIVI